MATNNPCFDNVIGLRGSCYLESTSNLFVNDIGISLNELNDFCTEDFASGEELFKTQKDLAIAITSQNIHTFFQERYKAFSLIDGKRIGFYGENPKLIIGTPDVNKGILIELNSDRSYTTFHLSELTIDTPYNGTININVWDLTSGTIVDTFPINTNGGGRKTFYPNKSYNSNRQDLRLFISYNTTMIDYNTATLTQSAGCASCANKPFHNNEFLMAVGGQIAVSAQQIKQNFKSTNDTGGLSIVYSLNCNHENWLCAISNLTALPILWKTAALIMEFGMYITPNEMMNNRSTMNRDLLKERHTLYENKFNESMSNLFNNIELPKDERCFICRERSRTTIMLP